MKPWLYRAGAYLAYPLLAALGGLLLARGRSPGTLAAASVLLAGDLALPAVLGAYCRRCGERPGPRLLRLLILPAAVCAALAFRSAQTGAQFAALALIALAVVAFGVAFRFTQAERLPRQY